MTVPNTPDPSSLSSDLSKAHPKLASSSSTMDNEEDATLIGSHCQYTYCHQLDFLPFRCDSCHHTFCLDHRSETAHKCAHAGEWAAQRRKAEAAARPSQSPSNASAAARSLLDVETPRACAGKACRTIVGKGVVQGVQCPGCNRTYCLSHRLKEDHDCKNLVPLGVGARTTGSVEMGQARAMAALGRLKAWGTAKKEDVARTLPKARPSTASARMVAVNDLKKTAKGDEKVASDKRVYLYVEAEAATTRAKFPKGKFFYNKEWVVGRVLDAAAKSLMVENVNNQGLDEKEKIRVFHIEGGRLLEYGEKVGSALVSGNTIVLLRGVGPAVPDLIQV